MRCEVRYDRAAPSATDGAGFSESIATAGRAQGGVAELCRIENPAPGGRPCLEAIPDAAVRDAILERVNGSPLQEVCEITAKHTVRELSLGESTVSRTLDQR